MSSLLFYDSDDERDSFDVERRQLEIFQNHCLTTQFESSDDDEEGIIDGTKIPSSSKARSRARHSFLDISTLSSSSSIGSIEENPFHIIAKSIDIQPIEQKKKKKSLGVPKSRAILDTNDIYDEEDQEPQPTETSPESKEKKSRIRKPTKAAILETERKTQQLSRSEQLVLPTFIPKPLENWQAMEKRSRQELLNEIRAKNPSFTPQDPDLPELPLVEPEPTVSSTLTDLTKLIEEKAPSKIDKLSRFLNPAILAKKPTISNLSKQSNVMIDLSESKKNTSTTTPKIKTNIILPFDSTQSPSSSKKLFDMQKQLGMRMRAKRAAMLAENQTNLPSNDDNDDDDDDEEDVKEIEEDASMDTSDESNDPTSDVVSNIDKDDEIVPMDEETQDFLSNDEEEDDDDVDGEAEKEQRNPPSDPNRPSLKTILNRMESYTEPEPASSTDQNGQAEWFASSPPAEVDRNLELLCSGAFGGDNIIPLSQNRTQREPMPFSPLPPTQPDDDDDDDIVDKAPSRTKVRQVVDDEDEEQSGEPVNSGSTLVEDENEEEEEEMENEELVDYKKQLFEMEAEESGSDAEEKPADDESDDDSDDEPDEELAKFIDTAAEEIDEEEADNIAKVHLKIKAKEDEHQLKLLKEQYLHFDGDDDGRRIQISKAIDDDDDEDDPDYNSDHENDDDDDDEEEDPTNAQNRLHDLERQRSIQDTQAEQLHLDEDLENIGQGSSMFQKGLALKQKKIQSSVTHISLTETTKTTDSTRSVTMSSVLLAQRFSSTLLAPVNKGNLVLPPNPTATSDTNLTTKKQHNPRRHVFATNENQNPGASTSGEKRANSTEKSPSTKVKRFKQSSTMITSKQKETSTTTTTSVFSALALSSSRR